MTHMCYHPITEEPIFIHYTETGCYRSATMTDPEEYPEIEIDGIQLIIDDVGPIIDPEDAFLDYDWCVEKVSNNERI